MLHLNFSGFHCHNSYFFTCSMLPLWYTVHNAYYISLSLLSSTFGIRYASLNTYNTCPKNGLLRIPVASSLSDYLFNSRASTTVIVSIGLMLDQGPNDYLNSTLCKYGPHIRSYNQCLSRRTHASYLGNPLGSSVGASDMIDIAGMLQSLKIWGAGSNAARRCCLAVPSDLPKSGGAAAPSAPSLAASLHCFVG